MNSRLGDDSVLVITDSQYGAVFADTNFRGEERVVIVTVRDDATEEQRDKARQRAAEIVAARHGEAT